MVPQKVTDSKDRPDVPESATVYVVSGDPALRDSLANLIDGAGLHAESFSSLSAWLGSVPPGRRGCIVVDARNHELAQASRDATLSSLCSARPVLLLVDRGDVLAAVRALKKGAADVVEKPCRNETILERIKAMVAAAGDARQSADSVRKEHQ